MKNVLTVATIPPAFGQIAVCFVQFWDNLPPVLSSFTGRGDGSMQVDETCMIREGQKFSFFIVLRK